METAEPATLCGVGGGSRGGAIGNPGLWGRIRAYGIS